MIVRGALRGPCLEGRGVITAANSRNACATWPASASFQTCIQSIRSWGWTRFKGEYLGTVADRIVAPRVHYPLSRSPDAEPAEFLPNLAWLGIGAVTSRLVWRRVLRRMQSRRAFGRCAATRRQIISLTAGAIFCGSVWPQSVGAADHSPAPAAV